MIGKADGQVRKKNRKNRQNCLRTESPDQKNQNQRREPTIFMKNEAQNLSSLATGIQNGNSWGLANKDIKNSRTLSLK